MSRKLSTRSNLDTLRKEARRWQKALQTGDDAAHLRLRAALPSAPANPSLRDIQLALAREYGLPGWTALHQTIEDLKRSHAERVDMILRSADWSADHATGARLVTRWPETGRENLYTAVATGNVAEVQRHLAADPTAANRRGGPLDREPLLYLGHSRLPGSEVNGIEIARLLLDHDADPNARWIGPWGEPAFTVLTGLIGEGEGDQAPHQQARFIATLLIERGADPFDPQALYNTSITRDDTDWLDFLWSYSEARGRLDAWRAPGTIGGRLKLSALDYLLGNATAYNHLERAQWLLARGADPNGPHAYSKRPQREEALIYGYEAMAQLLEQSGAEQAALEGISAFRAACMRLDRAGAEAAIAADPACLTDAETMLSAARMGRTDVISLLLELGMDVDVADHIKQRGLQLAIAGGSLDTVKLLVTHGADIDRPTKSYGDGAMGYAAHFNMRDIATFLAPLSRDVHNMTYLGYADRLAELFAEDPALVNARHHRTECPPLFFLPPDEADAVAMASVLLAHGADPTLTNPANGLTAEETMRKRGLIDLADVLAEGGAGR